MVVDRSRASRMAAVAVGGSLSTTTFALPWRLRSQFVPVTRTV